ncbi:ATP synthase F1 subunit epsilon [Candidatus Roizmanbacteria bacterium]|nr:MAG: ATP synthase F1 subunit epsilon [Candidatus Roizmanbacteria bacterium]
MIHLKVITPKKLAFEKDVTSITVPTVAGELTILPKHSDLLSLLKEGVVTIRTEKEEQYMSIGGGYMQTDGKSIQILVSRAFGQDEINEEMTQRAIESAQKVLEEVEDKAERTEALSTLRRSMVDMKLLSKMRRKAKA